MSDTDLLQSPIMRARDIALLQNAERLHQQANDTRNAAQKDAEVLRAQAREEGRNEGVTEGSRIAAGLIASARLEADRVARDLEAQLAGLVSDVVRQIIGAGDRDTLVSAAVGKALAELADHRPTQLHVAVDIFDTVNVAVATMNAAGAGSTPVEVQCDEDLPSGSCLFSNKKLRADIGLDAQVDAALSALTSDEMPIVQPSEAIADPQSHRFAPDTNEGRVG